MEELELLAVPSRSRLYRLEPIGLGTSQVESVTSYVIRLAKAHSVPARILVEREIFPLFQRAYLSKAYGSSRSSFWSKQARLLNGMGTWASDWVDALQTLTLRDDLRSLTMLTWADVLPSRGLLRQVRVWCPVCYEEWRESGQPIREPLLWTLQAVTICPRHRCLLRSECCFEDCQRRSPILARQARLGRCSWCGRWLGLPLERVEENAPAENELEWPIWVANSVGEMLASAPNLQSPPKRENIVRAVSLYVELVANGNLSAAARGLGLSRRTIMDYQRGVQLPQLGTLLQMCYHLDVSHVRLLTEGVTVDDFDSLNPLGTIQFGSRAQKRRQAFDVNGARCALEAALKEEPPPSMREVAKRLGYDHAYLLKRFPEVCREISTRRRARQKAKSVQRRQDILGEIRDATIEVHDRGQYPSQKRVSALLDQPCSIREPGAGEVWHETLCELGWE